MPRPIDSLELFYAHAIAIEHEAAERYGEFARYFEAKQEPVLAGLCRNLAANERHNWEVLCRASEGMELPPIEDSGYHWIDAQAPNAPAHELFYRVSSPQQLLQVALAAERSARRFFSGVARTTRDGAVRAVARHMAGEEAEHGRWVRQALEYREPLDWHEVLVEALGPGHGPGE